MTGSDLSEHDLVDRDGGEFVRHRGGHGGVPVAQHGQTLAVGPVNGIEHLVGVQLDPFNASSRRAREDLGSP